MPLFVMLLNLKIPLQLLYAGTSQKPIMAINVTFGVCATQFDEDSPLSVKQIKYFIQHSKKNNNVEKVASH